MEPEVSLPHSQKPVTCSYPERHQYNPFFFIHFLKIHFNIILPSTPKSCKWSSDILQVFTHCHIIFAHRQSHNPAYWRHLVKNLWCVQKEKQTMENACLLASYKNHSVCWSLFFACVCTRRTVLSETFLTSHLICHQIYSECCCHVILPVNSFQIILKIPRKCGTYI